MPPSFTEYYVVKREKGFPEFVPERHVNMRWGAEPCEIQDEHMDGGGVETSLAIREAGTLQRPSSCQRYLVC